MMSPWEFLSTATMLRQNTAEANLRSCVSRAYYSMFHAAQSFAERRYPDRYVGRGAAVHERLIQAFQSSNDIAARNVGYALNAMRTLRSRADYELHKPVTERDADDALKRAHDFKELIATTVSTASSPRGRRLRRESMPDR